MTPERFVYCILLGMDVQLESEAWLGTTERGLRFKDYFPSVLVGLHNNLLLLLGSDYLSESVCKLVSQHRARINEYLIECGIDK